MNPILFFTGRRNGVRRCARATVVKGAVLAVALVLAGLCVGEAPARAAMTGDQALATFVKANFVYKDGHYKKAAALYKGIVRQGWESAGVYYNLGNAYFKQDQLGRALLNYERARLFAPRDHDVLANYRYALSRTQSIVLPENESPVLHWFRQWTWSYTVRELALALLGLAALAAILHLLALFQGWPRRRKVLALLTVFCAMGIVAAGLFIKIDNLQGLAVVVERSEARFEPRDGATVHFTLYEGQQVRILDQEGPWTKIARPDGNMGWVPAQNVDRVIRSGEEG